MKINEVNTLTVKANCYMLDWIVYTFIWACLLLPAAQYAFICSSVHDGWMLSPDFAQRWESRVALALKELLQWRHLMSDVNAEPADCDVALELCLCLALALSLALVIAASIWGKGSSGIESGIESSWELKQWAARACAFMVTSQMGHTFCGRLCCCCKNSMCALMASCQLMVSMATVR